LRTRAMCLGAAALLLITAAPGKTPEQTEARLSWWRKARFGLFVHWGPVSLKGTEISWSRGGERRGLTGTGSIPVDIYDNLYHHFNPTRFDAREWVSIAQAAGVKYLVFTTKHHDGFCMFDSALTDYKITNAPIGRDLTAELATACHEAGLRLGFYYSPPDWHHPDYRTDNHERYVSYLHGQLQELCRNYGRVDIIWFDGLGGKSTDWRSEDLFAKIRKLQPQVLLNNRGGLPGDFDTPEQRVGRVRLDRPWESCITICRQWAWKPNDKLKSLSECIHTLVRCAGGDGNLLLNVGPMPSGEIEPRQVARLKQIGDWLRQNGQSIYATRGGPYAPAPWGASTRRDNRIYLHILSWDQQPLELPPIAPRIVAGRLLTGGTVTVRQTAQAVRIEVPPVARQPIDTIAVLELDASAWQIPLKRTWPKGVINLDKPATASNVYRRMATQYGPAKAVDADPDSRWATDAGTHQAWLEIDLGTPLTFDRAVIKEAFERVRSFQIQVKDNDVWKPIAQGTTIGPELKLNFNPVTARYVRLAILEAIEGPTIWEFQLYSPAPPR